MGYEWQIHSYLDFYMSLDGVSVPIRVTWCWLSSLGCTGQDLSIQEVHQPCCFMLLLYCSVHVYIFHKEHLWCLEDIPVVNALRVDLLLRRHQFSSILDSAVAARIVFCTQMMLKLRCCVINILGIYLWWASSEILSVIRSGRTWA